MNAAHQQSQPAADQLPADLEIRTEVYAPDRIGVGIGSARFVLDREGCIHLAAILMMAHDQANELPRERMQ